MPQYEHASTLKVLHLGHYVVDKMNLRARETGISNNIKAIYYRCDICAKFARTQQKEMLQYVETPQSGWEQLGVDIFSLTLLICYLWVTIYDTVVRVAITNVTNIAN